MCIRDRCYLVPRSFVHRQESDHLLAHAGQLDIRADQHLGGDALTLADKTEQDVLSSDVGVAQLERLAQRQLENLSLIHIY